MYIPGGSVSAGGTIIVGLGEGAEVVDEEVRGGEDWVGLGAGFGIGGGGGGEGSGDKVGIGESGDNIGSSGGGVERVGGGERGEGGVGVTRIGVLVRVRLGEEVGENSGIILTRLEQIEVNSSNFFLIWTIS